MLIDCIYGDHIVLFVDETGFNDHNCLRKRWVLPETEDNKGDKIKDSNLSTFTLVEATSLNKEVNYMILDSSIN